MNTKPITDYQTAKGRMQGVRPLNASRHFDLVDNDDFFGFDPKDRSWGIFRGLVAVLPILIGIIILVTAWASIAHVQKNCLDGNQGNITMCD